MSSKAPDIIAHLVIYNTEIERVSYYLESWITENSDQIKKIKKSTILKKIRIRMV